MYEFWKTLILIATFAQPLLMIFLVSQILRAVKRVDELNVLVSSLMDDRISDLIEGEEN